MIYQLFLRFSGILAMFVAWIFVVGPAIHHGIDAKSQTITSATVENEKVLKFISFGLIVGAFLQAFFLFYLIQKFQMPLLGGGVGSLMYLTSNIATILVALLHYSKFPKIHDFFAKYYFIISPLSLGFIGFSTMKTGLNLFLFSVVIVTLYFTGSFLLIKRTSTENALLEIWAFIMLSIWTIVLTLA